MPALTPAALRRKVAPAAAIVLVFLVAGTALAGAGYGGAIQIGLNNLAASYQTNLIATASNKTALAVTNHATSGVSRAISALSKSPSATAIYAQNWYGSALQLVTPTDEPPMIVNSAVRVANLNAARAGVADNSTALGGVGAAGYQKRVAGTCTAGQKITAINADGTVTCHVDAVDGGDAQTLDGADSSAFTKGSGRIEPRRELVPVGGSATWTSAGFPSVRVDCAQNRISYSNGTGVTFSVVTDNAGADPTSQELASEAESFESFSGTGDRITYQASTSDRMETVTLTVLITPDGCLVQGQRVTSTF